jgi:aminopeptidase YwaD
MKETTMIHIFSLLLTLCVTHGAMTAQTTSSAIAAGDVRARVQYLASDSLEGRGSGTAGNRKAAAYIADLFAGWHLKPLGDQGTYFQNFEFVASVKPGPSNVLHLTFSDGRSSALVMDQDFRPLGFTLDTTVSAPVVFAGYGISAQEKDYDDYAGLDVRGKIVIVLRHAPGGSNPHGDYSRFTPLREKTRMARDHGAAALLIVTGPADDPDDDIMKLTYDQSFASSGLAAVSMKRAVLESLLSETGRKLSGIQDSINDLKKPICVEFGGVTASLTTEVVKVKATTANVVGLLQGSDASRSSQSVIIGAHFDHLGYGGEGSGSMTPDRHEIHNGADDNASGTAGLLELAEACAAHREKFPRSLLFIAFSGEEIGTLGSAYYVDHASLPLDSAMAMVNLDMIGRLKDNTLTLNGTGTSPVWDPLIKKLNTGDDGKERFTLKIVADGFGPSDHASFYRKDMPVLFFFTGTHEDYHKPSDDWDKLNYEGQQQVVSFAYDVVADLAERPDRPEFRKTQSAGPMAGGGGFTVTLGVIPDYAWTGEGMKIDGVRGNGPAEKAGLQAGDVIVSLAGKKVMNIYDYMGVLGELKPGQEVTVSVNRAGEVITKNVTMTKRQ